MSPRRSRLPAFRARLLLAFVVVVALTVIAFVAVNVLVEAELSSVTRVNVNVADSPSSGANYLLIGSDTRAFVKSEGDRRAFGDQADAGGTRSDTIMILHVYPNSTRGLLVSFPRDLWVSVPGRGMAKINSAFNDGPQKMIDTLTTNFDVPINHYVELNFETFRGLVDAVGTVPVLFPAPSRDTVTGLNVVYPGCAQLDGSSALAYVRSRHLQIIDPTTQRWRDLDAVPDIGRVARQQAFLRELGSVAMDKVLSNPFSAPDIIDHAVAKLKLDDGFGRGDLFSLVAAFHREPGDESGLETQTLPWTEGTAGGQSVLFAKKPDAEQLLGRLRDFGEPPPASTPASSPGDVSVRVLNASGVDGAAARALDRLEKAGFDGAGTGNTTTRSGPSEIRYAAEHEAAARLLQPYVGGPVRLVAGSSGGADVTLVVGTSFTGIGQAPPPASTMPGATSTPGSTTATSQPSSLSPVPGC